jgi:hypothetical protein
MDETIVSVDLTCGEPETARELEQPYAHMIHECVG